MLGLSRRVFPRGRARYLDRALGPPLLLQRDARDRPGLRRPGSAEGRTTSSSATSTRCARPFDLGLAWSQGACRPGEPAAPGHRGCRAEAAKLGGKWPPPLGTVPGGHERLDGAAALGASAADRLAWHATCARTHARREQVRRLAGWKASPASSGAWTACSRTRSASSLGHCWSCEPFPKIAAAVSDVGGMMSRRDRRPRVAPAAVVGTGGATSTIKTADRVPHQRQCAW